MGQYAYQLTTLPTHLLTMTFSLDTPSTLPARIGSSDNWEVAAGYHIASKSRWARSKHGRPNFFPATVLAVEPSRQFALVRYHDDAKVQRVPADRIFFPAHVTPAKNRCSKFDELLRTGPIPAPPAKLPPPSTKRNRADGKPSPTPGPTVLPTTSTKRTFEMDTDSGGKYWTITLDGLVTTTTWGPRGSKPTPGHTSTRTHLCPVAASVFTDDIIASKLAKGYSEVTVSAPTAVAAKWAQKCTCCTEQISPGDLILCGSAGWVLAAHA